MEALDNLVKINQLKLEPFDANEFAGMLRTGDNKLKDSAIAGLSADSQFMLAYGAAHSFSLAALRLAWVSIRKSLFGVSVLAAYIGAGEI